MAQCPSGHDSAATDYCDVCGLLMEDPAAIEDVGLVPPDPEPAPGPPCPRCGTPGLGQFCESCGYSERTALAEQRVSPAEPARLPQQESWTAVVSASRPHYDATMAALGPGAPDVRFPDEYPERTFTLTGSRLRIGRRSQSREVAPEIDLTGPPADPGISRLHAVFLAQPDGSWAVMDPGSENGTIVNEVEIRPGQPMQLRSGDSICIGAWTSIVIVETTG
jgi:hypothetical protein